MSRHAFGLTIALFIIPFLFIENYLAAGRRETIDWGDIIAPMNLPPHSMHQRRNDDDKEGNSLCPIIRPGENIAQPWRGEATPPDLPLFTDDRTQLSSAYTGTQPDCNDNSPNVVIKILFNRDDPCVKISDASMLQIDNPDETDGTTHQWSFFK